MAYRKVVVIGGGWIGRRHVEAHIENPNVGIENVILAELKQDVRDEAKAEFPGLLVVDDFHPYLSDQDVVSMDVCTSNRWHMSIACEAAQAGKHLLIEKPLARNMEECKQIVEAVSAAGVQMLMMANNAVNPKIRMLRHMVESGQLGTIREVKGAWRRRSGTPFSGIGVFTDMLESGGGAGIDLMPHVITASMTIAGWPEMLGVKAYSYRDFGPQEIGRGCYGGAKYKALADGGLTAIELTLRTPIAMEALAML